jgi:RNA-dependent RNA polymerase
MEEIDKLLEAYSKHLVSIARIHTISKSRDARVSEADLISGTVSAKWSNHRKRRDAIVAMNLQVHIIIR